MKPALLFGCLLALVGCTASVDDTDPGIYVPNPGLTLKIAAGTQTDSIVVALARQIDQITVVDCAGVRHEFPFGGPLSSEDDSSIYLESEALTCAEEIQIDGSDVEDAVALVLGVERNGNSARLKCPAARCFPMVFSGRLELDAPETEESPPHEMRWNVLAKPEQVRPEEAADDYVAGECGDNEVCRTMETSVTSDALLEERPADSEDWNIAMTVK